MTDRYWKETECVHGDVEPHGIGINARIAGHIDCASGSRVELLPATPNYEAAVEQAARAKARRQSPGFNSHIAEVVDAALAGVVLLQEPEK